MENIKLVKASWLRHFLFAGLFLFSSHSAVSNPGVRPTLHKPLHQIFGTADSTSILDSNLTNVGNWPWGACSAVCEDSPYTVICNGQLLQFLSWNPDSSQPSVYAEYNPGFGAADMHISRGVLFISSSLDFVAFDVNDPKHIVRLGSLQLSDYLGSFQIDDSMAVLMSQYGFVYVVDISDPTSPRLRSTSETANANPWTIDIKAGFCYIGESQSPQIEVFDVRNPDSIKAGITFYPNGFTTAMIIRDSFLILGVGGRNSIQIYSLADPSKPSLYSEMSLPRYDSLYLSSFAVSGAHLFATTDSDGTFEINISNISNLAHPQILDRKYLPLMNNNGGGELSMGPSGLVEVACQNGLVAYRAADSLHYLGFFPTAGHVQGIASRGSLVALASGIAGLWLVDASIPAAPRKLANINNGGYSLAARLRGNCLIVYDELTLLSPFAACYLYDISDSSHPKYEGKIQPPPLSPLAIDGVSMCIDQNMLFITQNHILGVDSPSVMIYDISDSTNPKEIAHVNTTFSVLAMIAHDGILYLGARDSGLFLIDYSSIQNVHPVASLRNGRSETVAGFGIEDSTLYLYSSIHGISAYNVSARGITDTLGYLPAQAWNYPVDLCANGKYLYYQGTFIGDVHGSPAQLSEVAAIDISDPSRMTQSGFWVSYISGGPLAASSGNAYLGAEGPEMYVLHNSLVTGFKPHRTPMVPASYSMNQNFPNPFNPTTTISYELPKETFVHLSIFNILGQEVRTLVNRMEQAGYKSVSFDANEIPSGTYFYRMTAGAFTDVKKLMLIK